MSRPRPEPDPVGDSWYLFSGITAVLGISLRAYAG